MTLEQFLISICINIASAAVYDFIKSKTITGISKTELTSELSYLLLEGSHVKAEKIINFLAQNGDIIIKNSQVFAKEEIQYSSNNNTSFTLENSLIEVGVNAKIVGQGGAEIHQNPDGSITNFINLKVHDSN